MELPMISSPYGISNEDYHNGKEFKNFLSSSQLKDFLVSPKYFRYKELNPEEEGVKLHFNRGSVYHDMLACLANDGNIEGFRDYWAEFKEPINEKTGKAYGPQTKAYVEAYEDARIQASGRDLCGAEDIALAYAMIGELIDKNSHLSKDIRFLIKVGKGEISHFCKYQGQGFKYRTDLKTSGKIVDWKSCAGKTAHPGEVHRQIIKFNYHISGAFYQFFDHLTTGEWRSFYWVFQETEPPFDFIIESADNWCFEVSRNEDGEKIGIPKIGAMIFLKILEEYLNCRETGIYHGYSSLIQPGFRGQRIHSGKPPGWYNNILINFFN